MPSSRPSKVSNRQWEEHKSVIERLYLRDNLTLQGEDGCEGVIAYMSRVHAFDASPSQYEDRLKHWGIRKNLTHDDWITVKRMLDIRGVQGKESDVYVSGKALKESQVRKGISRPGVRNAVHQDTGLVSLDTQLPSYLEVRSPELLPQQEGTLQENTLHIPGNGPEPNEPYPVSEEQLDLLECSLIPSRSPQMHSTFETQYIQSDRRISDNYLMQEMVVSPTTDLTRPETETDMLVQKATRKKILGLIPSDTFSVTEIASWVINIPELNEFQNSSQLISRLAYIQSTRSMIPARHSSNLADITQGAGIMRIAIYELVNQKFQSQHHLSQPVEWIMGYLQQNRSLQSFAELERYMKSPTLLKALHRNLFMAALCVKAYPIMSFLLVASAAPKSLVLSSIYSEQNYLREWADILYSGPSELVTTILQRCDDFTKAKLKVIQKCFGFSNNYMPYPGKYFDGYPRNVKLLRDEGFQLNWPRLAQAALFSGNFYHVKSIMGLIPHSEFGHIIQGSLHMYEEHASDGINLAILAVRKLSEKDALWVIHTLVKHLESNPLPESQCSTIGDIISMEISSSIHKDYSTSALEVAVSREYDSVINYLISRGARTTAGCLYEATFLKRIDLVKRFLEDGVSPIQIVASNRGFYREITTPYAEALRTGYYEAMRLFDEQPFITPRSQAQRSLISAASEIGDRKRLEEYLEALKKRYVNLNSSHYELQETLRNAEKMARDHGHLHILDALFEAGVTPTIELYENAMMSRDYDRLTKLFTGSNGTSPPGLSRSIARLEDYNLAAFIVGCIDFQEDPCKGEFLKQAIYSNNVVLIEQLLHIGISPNSLFDIKPFDDTEDRKAIQEHIGSLETPLIVAIRCKNKHIVNMLLKHLAFLNPQRHDYQCTDGYYDSELQIYIRNQFKPVFLSALEAAVQCEDMELVHDLLSRGADPYDSNALVSLVRSGNYDMLETILHRQSREEYSGAKKVIPALTEALSCDNSDIVYLLSHHADLERLSTLGTDSSALGHRYAKDSDNEVYEYSVAMNTLGRVIDGFACQRYSLDTVRSLLYCRSNAGAICLVLSKVLKRRFGNNTRSFTPLNLAVFWDSMSLLNLLKEHGANINGSYNNLTKRTPLQLAAEFGRLDIVSQLIRLGADVNWPPTPCKGFTALQLTAKHGFYRIAEVLLEHKAKVDWPAARIHGRTAFEAATENGRLDMMLLLVRSGADLISSAGNKQFERAVKFAKARGEEPAITLAHELREIVQRVTLEARGEAFDALLERVFAR